MKILLKLPTKMKEYLTSEYKKLYKTKRCLFCNNLCNKEYKDHGQDKNKINWQVNSWYRFTQFNCNKCKIKRSGFDYPLSFHLDMGPTQDPHFMRFYIGSYKIEINFDQDKVYIGDENKNMFDISITINGIDNFIFSFKNADKLYKKVSTCFNFS